MAFGIVTIVIYCVLNCMPHFLFGPGDDALSLTVEYGGVKDDQQTKAIQEMNNKKLICQSNGMHQVQETLQQ
jgi:solute carrier organic anion transporter family, member 5A